MNGLYKRDELNYLYKGTGSTKTLRKIADFRGDFQAYILGGVP